ncbi:diguanylate cyclase [Candidatus Cryosericum terrychapinii]|uniref:diguanylate cyclase n=1 Tax=Candidatus Cryosericum terrychapinii TaxID=2290919 RepID=A0A398CTJ5_9BACT|nr:diguanylate cyclase [Candidatus Cryosericum terrychapinii]
MQTVKPGERNTARILILLRYAVIAGGSVWWLLAMLSQTPGAIRLVLLPGILVTGIAFNVALDLMERFAPRGGVARAILRHQILFDGIAMNLFLGAMGSPLLMGKPVFYGGTRILPFDASFVVSGAFLVIASIILQNGHFPLYLTAALASLVVSQGLSIAQQQGSGFIQALRSANWGGISTGMLAVAGVGILSYVADEHVRHSLHAMDTRVADVSRDKERMQAAFHKLSFLTAIIQDMAASQAYQQVLEAITDRAALFFSADDAIVATIDADMEHLSVVAAKSEYREALSHLRIRRGEGILGKTFDGDTPELIKNALLDPRAMQIYGTPEEPESIMVAPLRRGSQKYGLVSVSRIGVENPFNEDDLALFTSFANIAASVLDNATMMEALKRKNFTLTVTNQLSSAIVSPLPFEEEISSFLSIMNNAFQLSCIDLLMVENDRFTRLFSVPAPKSPVPPQEIIARMNAGAGVLGQALRERTIVNVPNITDYANYIMADETTHSELAIPMKNAEGRVIAVLNLESGQSDYFTNDVTTDVLAVAGEVQGFLQGRLIWEEVKEQRNIREAINRAELENIDVSTTEQATAHLSRLLQRILPRPGSVILLENSGNTARAWTAIRAASAEEAEPVRLFESELRARLDVTHSLSRSITGLLQGRDLLVRRLDFEQRLVGFVIMGIGDHRLLTLGETSAFDLFMAYAESIVQKIFLKQRSALLTKYRLAAKELLDTSFKRTDLQQFLAATARKLQDVIEADGSAYVPFEAESRQLVVSQADITGFTPEPGVEPGILAEAFSSPSMSVVHSEVSNTMVPLAPGAMTELTLRITLEGVLYGVLYVSFKRPVLLTDEERHMVEAFVSDCSLVAENILYVHRIDELSVTDELTGLGNYRAFVTHSIEQSERTARFGEVFSLLFFDIDDFKKYNDTYSHLDGNLALQGIADILRHSIRTVDSAYRYGGEEFVILMPGASPTDARKAAERILASVERNSARDHRHFRSVVTLSGGVANFEDRVSDPQNLLLLADLAMYQAKKSGKNTIYVLDSLASQKRTAPGS